MRVFAAWARKKGVPYAWHGQRATVTLGRARLEYFLYGEPGGPGAYACHVFNPEGVRCWVERVYRRNTFEYVQEREGQLTSRTIHASGMAALLAMLDAAHAELVWQHGTENLF